MGRSPLSTQIIWGRNSFGDEENIVSIWIDFAACLQSDTTDARIVSQLNQKIEWPVWFMFADQTGRLHLWDLRKKTPCRWCWQGVFDAGALFQTPIVGNGREKLRWKNTDHVRVQKSLQKIHKTAVSFLGFEGAIDIWGGNYRTGKTQKRMTWKTRIYKSSQKQMCVFRFWTCSTYMRG